jgi:sulfopyruvate decarboxylase subunit beta
MSGTGRAPSGSIRDALAALVPHRRDGDVVISTLTPARDWMALESHALDLVLVPSAMGHATSMGLGLALAQPDRRIIVLNGDGSMLMNLGSLVSISAAGPSNLIVLVFDNGSYEATGTQPTPGSAAGRVKGDRLDFAAVARGCGFQTVFHFADVATWTRDLVKVLTANGPTLGIVEVDTVMDSPGPRSPGPARERAKRFMEAIRTIPTN